MTKPGLALAVALTALALLAPPPAAAHGAATPREVDTRVLLDDDGLVPYGGCLGGECAAPAEGLDLVVLDVREAWLGDEPAVAFRIVTQSEGTGAGGLRLAFAAGGTAREFTVDDALAPTAASTFDLVQGPFDVFDNHPKAIDGWVRLSTLGAQAGDELTGITVTSLAAGEPDDVMPGGWYAQGQLVPHVPHEPGEVEPPASGAYTLKGPAPLVAIDPPTALVDLARGANVTFRLTNPLAATPQDVRLELVGDPGAGVSLDRLNVSLDAGATRQVVLTAASTAAGGAFALVARSDLGARTVANVTVIAAPVVEATSSASASGSSAAKDAPGLPLPVLLAALAALATAGVRRR